jgi:hypothetical protein
MPSRARIRAFGAGLAGGYLLLVAVLAVLRRASGWPDPQALASSPADLATGHVWSLITSGLVVAGEPTVQLAATALTVALVIQLLGASAFWAAALAAHVGSAVIAYAGVGVLWLVAGADVDALVEAPDYGISCVWAGAAGALAAAAFRRRSARVRVLAPVAIGAGVGIVAPAAGLAGVEHGLAFALGALTVAVGRRSGAALSSPAPA